MSGRVWTMRFGEGFAETGDGPGHAHGSLHFWHEDVAHLRPGDKVVIEAEVRSNHMIGGSQLCKDGFWRQIPDRVVDLKSNAITVRVVRDES